MQTTPEGQELYQHVQRAMDDVRFDVAIRVREVDDGRLARRSLGRFRSCLCAAPSYLRARGAPRTLEELAGHVVLSYLRDNRQEAWDPATKRWVRIRAPYAADSNAALRQLALDGLGIARLPELTVLEDLEQGALTRLPLVGLEEEEGAPIALVFPQGKQLSARVRAFVDFFADEARRSLPQPRARSR